MRIVSWNVNGIRAIAKKDFFEDIKKIDPDILCLQETKAQEEEVQEVLSHLEDYHQYYNSAERRGYSGTAILTKIKPLSVSYDMNIAEHDSEGRVLCAEYVDFFLVNVYVPNSGQKLERLEYRADWDRDFRDYLNNLNSKKPVVLCGDLNVAHQAIDLKNDKANYNKSAGYTQIEIDGMDNLLDSGFIDSYRHFNPTTEAYTYWSYRFKARERNSGWRIDYFLINPILLEKVKNVEILSDFYGSDHCPIQVELEV